MKAIVIFDIDGVLRDVGGSYRRAIADTVEYYTSNAYRPTMEDIDRLKSEGIWNNDWEASQELIYRYFEGQNQTRDRLNLNYQEIIAFFQSRYLGDNPQHWTGYICDEPLLCNSAYFQQLTQAEIAWGFFSGATRAEALYLLQGKLEIDSPVLVAMEDAPGKPDPTGLLDAVQQLIQRHCESETETIPIIYIGDTVADLYTVEKAKQQQPSRHWVGVGVLPPHIQTDTQRRQTYSANLQQAGAKLVLNNVLELTPIQIEKLVKR
ncbi:MAG: TIGR01548 family HAD-type hydrolase [Microcoleaceae cyanobacterium]